MVSNKVTVCDESVTVIEKENGSKVIVTTQGNYVIAFNPNVVVGEYPLICYVTKCVAQNIFSKFKATVWDLCAEGNGSKYFDNPCTDYHLRNGYTLNSTEKEQVKAYVSELWHTYI